MTLQTVIETPEFIKQARTCMDDQSKMDFIHFIAANPEEGEVMLGCGGARKVRWQSHIHSGKRGGVRIIYYYHDENMPIYLFTVYKKNQRENIAASEKKILYEIIKLIVKANRSKER